MITMFSLILSRKALDPVFVTQICNTSKNVKKLMNEKLIDVLRNIVGLSFWPNALIKTNILASTIQRLL